MARAETSELMCLLDLALELAKDKAFEDALRAVQTAQREYLIAEADARRARARAVIQEMAKLDVATRRLRYEYVRIQPELTPNAQAHFDKLFAGLARQRDRLAQKKRSLSALPGTPQIAPEHINGVELRPGDVLAVSRKAGLYQHFAVYIGDDKVIHYAAEGGDFAGRITIHEAALSEFRADSTFIYILDFPDDAGYPTMRTRQGELPVYGHAGEGPFFRLIRESGYHLYSPEETVARARSRVGEGRYNLATNNCEHFAIWCKTGVHESHQVNRWLERLSRIAGPSALVATPLLAKKHPGFAEADGQKADV